MKYLIFVPLMLIALNAQANEQSCCGCAFPKHVVKKKKKVQPKLPACEKVVREVVKEKIVYNKTTVIREIVKTIPQKNHLRLYGGIAPGGVSLTDTPALVSFSQNYGLVVGVGYGRNFSDRWSIEGVAITNGSGLLGVGYNW